MSSPTKFQIHALPYDRFQHFFTMTPDELQQHRAIRQTVLKSPGYPCRVSLQDGAVGEQVILLHYTHQPAESPFHASHGLFVRENAVEAKPAAGEIPVFLNHRLLSLRAFDEHGMMLNAEVAPGNELPTKIPAMLQEPQVAYLHLHNAREGCYLARVDRA